MLQKETHAAERQLVSLAGVDRLPGAELTNGCSQVPLEPILFAKVVEQVRLLLHVQAEGVPREGITCEKACHLCVRHQSTQEKGSLGDLIASVDQAGRTAPLEDL